jgi:thymidylate synthase
MVNPKQPDRIKVELWLRDHEFATSKDLYKQFPEVREDRLRKIKFEWFKQKDLEELLAGKPKVSPNPTVTLKSIETEDIIVELLRIYNLSDDQTKIQMMRTSILDLWKFKHKVPAKEADEESLGDILRELQKPRETVTASASAETSPHH